MTLVDSEVAALMLRVSPRRIQQLVHEGQLHNYGTPRRLQLDIDEVETLRLRCV